MAPSASCARPAACNACTIPARGTRLLGGPRRAPHRRVETRRTFHSATVSRDALRAALPGFSLRKPRGAG